MRLAHPPPQSLPPLHPRLVPPPRHPLPKVLRARPARIQLPEQLQELPHFGLLRWCGDRRVRAAHGVQERPGGAAKGLDVGGAVGGEGRRGGGGGCGGGEGGGRRGEGAGLLLDHGGPVGDGGTGAAA